MTPSFRRQFLPSLAIGLLVFVLVFAAQRFGWFQRWELAAYDWLLRARSDPTSQDERIVIVGYSEDDVTQFGYPINDDRLADLIERVRSAQPRAIGLDLFRNLPEPREKGALPRLASALRDTENLIAIFSLPDANRKHISPPPSLVDLPERLAFNDFPLDHDVVRRGLLFATSPDGETYPSFALSLALAYLQHDGISLEAADPAHPEWLRLGKATLKPFRPDDGGYVGADAGGYQVLLDFKFPRSFRTFSYGELVAGRVPSDALRDRIVLIASAAESVKDNHGTPLERNGDGIVLHAQIINQLLREASLDARQIKVWPKWVETLWCLSWTLGGAGVGFLLLRHPVRASIYLAGAFAGLAWLTRAAFFHDWWIPAVATGTGYISSAICSLGFVYSLKRRELGELMQMFSRHVSVKVARSLWDQREKFFDGHRPRSLKLTATVLFTDYINYSTVAETMEPVALLDWLNTSMERLANYVEEYDGVVVKFMGDSIMAVFGAPIPRTSQGEVARDAQDAVRCALAMSAELEKLNQHWKTEGLPRIGMRIGVHTGSVVAGCIGSSARLEFTVTGDTVVTASRLESKSVADIPPPTGRCCRILIGESTHELLGGLCEAEFVGKEALKGKASTTNVFRIIGEAMTKYSETQTCL